MALYYLPEINPPHFVTHCVCATPFDNSSPTSAEPEKKYSTSAPTNITPSTSSTSTSQSPSPATPSSQTSSAVTSSSSCSSYRLWLRFLSYRFVMGGDKHGYSSVTYSNLLLLAPHRNH